MQGQIYLAILLLIVIIISLTFHEFGHAFTAKKFGDDTAERMGRLTLNPVAHIDPMGLIMVAVIGFGYAKPVPTDPRNFTSRYASLWVSAAGPGMNLVLAIISVNLFVAAEKYQIGFLSGTGPMTFLQYMALINLLLMLFNLLPIGPLDGHYILPYFMSRDLAYKYLRWNDRYGSVALLSLIALSIIGIPVFSYLMRAAGVIANYLVVI